MKIRKIELSNTANVVRNYLTFITFFSSVVIMISGLVITKEVDKFILADGALTISYKYEYNCLLSIS